MSPTEILHLQLAAAREIVTGVVEARHVAVPLGQALRRTRVVPARATAIDVGGRTATVTSADGSGSVEPWDRSVLAPRSVNRQVEVPGLAERAHGLKTWPTRSICTTTR